MFFMFSTLYIYRQTYSPIIFDFHPNRSDFFLFFFINHPTLIVNQISFSGSYFDFYFITQIWILTIVICIVNSTIENFKLYLRHKVSSDRCTTSIYIYIYIWTSINFYKHSKQRWIDEKSTGFGTMSIDEDHRSNISIVVYNENWTRTSKTKI